MHDSAQTVHAHDCLQHAGRGSIVCERVSVCVCVCVCVSHTGLGDFQLGLDLNYSTGKAIRAAREARAQAHEQLQTKGERPHTQPTCTMRLMPRIHCHTLSVPIAHSMAQPRGSCHHALHCTVYG